MPYISSKVMKKTPAFYRECSRAFHEPLQNVNLRFRYNQTGFDLASTLIDHSVYVKVLAQGVFRIKVPVSAFSPAFEFKLPKPAHLNVNSHIKNGLQTAIEIYQVLNSKSLKKGLVSPNILFFDSLVDTVHLAGLARMKEVLEPLSNVRILRRIQVLQRNGCRVKILRDRAFRFTRLSIFGHVAQEYKLFRQPNETMADFIERALQSAESDAQVSWPYSVSRAQKFNNRFLRPLKRGLQKAFFP